MSLLSILTLLVLVAQLAVIFLQYRVYDRQRQIMERQIGLLQAEQQWRRDEAIGGFYRLAIDLARELGKSDGLAPGSGPAPVDAAEPRRMLREANRLFAPLGSKVLRRLHQVGSLLDAYYTGIDRFNAHADLVDESRLVAEIQEYRAEIGRLMTRADQAIEPELRWRSGLNRYFDFEDLYRVGGIYRFSIHLGQESRLGSTPADVAMTQEITPEQIRDARSSLHRTTDD